MVERPQRPRPYLKPAIEALDRKTAEGGPDLVYTNLSAQQIRAAKQRARRAVSLAVRAGLLTREPCVRCGATERVHAHHTDYNEPLLVVWVCEPHHQEIHRLEKTPREPVAEKLLAPRQCPCGRWISMPPTDQRGRRPRLCARCKQTRRALTFLRAGERILHNLRAIALGLEALRAVSRYGITTGIGEQYAGFLRLETSAADPERGRRLIEEAGSLKKALMQHHPDQGGDPRRFADVQAYRQLTGGGS